MQKVIRKVLRAVADYDPDYYDMYADANEAFFATLYVERIKRHAREAGIHPPATEAGTPAASLGEAKRAGVGEGRAPSRPAFRGRPDGDRSRSADDRGRVPSSAGWLTGVPKHIVRGGRSRRPTEPGTPDASLCEAKRWGSATAGRPRARHSADAPMASAPGVPSIADRRPTLLEAGCQAGRLVIPFARLGFQVTGVDTSRYALRRAQEHAEAAGVGATFVRGDVMEVLRRDPDRLFDIVVCAEVLYLSPRYREMLQALAGAVRPGGLLCVSHRPKFYYLLEAFRQYDLAAVDAVLQRNEGPFRDSAYYNWQTEEELRALYGSLG
ncbi:MAG: methyltransferase domain-containing protein, partial [Candidatus Omnitrophica bacterium]|nr:methyltransferase domain-containing protein [Candidatus Omnitrophota bacterium]